MDVCGGGRVWRRIGHSASTIYNERCRFIELLAEHGILPCIDVTLGEDRWRLSTDDKQAPKFCD